MSAFFPTIEESSWQRALFEEMREPYFLRLIQLVAKERTAAPHKIYPPNSLVFHALDRTPIDKVRVVILGQDPYHGFGQAHGLSFSVPKGVTPPPSLKNIYRELKEDVAFSPPDHGCLLRWADEGVFLLNATLTVAEGKPKSHYGMGWERFTDAIIRILWRGKKPIVFLLWGKSAQEKGEKVFAESKGGDHLVLQAAHPSPFSAHSGFFGCRHFSKTNRALESFGGRMIDWSLPK